MSSAGGEDISSYHLSGESSSVLRSSAWGFSKLLSNVRQLWSSCSWNDSVCLWTACFLSVSHPVVRNPPSWEVGVYLVGFLLLLGAAGLNIWKLWKSGTFPAPSPFPNFDYRYLQEKYGTSFSEVRQKVSLHTLWSWKGSLTANSSFWMFKLKTCAIYI